MKYDTYNIKLYNQFNSDSCKIVSRNKIDFIDDFMCLDTETSHTDLVKLQDGSYDRINCDTWIYQWAICHQNNIYNGRTPTQLIRFLDDVIKAYKLNEYKKLIIYIHNAAYDLTYLLPYLIKAYGLPKIIANDMHKIICANFQNGLCFRCSYKLSNKSLSKWSQDYNIKHKKLDGFVDYKEKHFPDSNLTYNDYKYMWHDVIAMKECLIKQLELYNHNIATIPLTSTGYIRELIYKSFRNDCEIHHNKAREDFRSTRLDYDTYNMCRLEMSGGITHGNRFLANKIVTPNQSEFIKHRDFESHYPTQQIVNKFPIGKFELFYTYNKNNKLRIKYLPKDKALLIKIAISDLVLRDKSITLPYAQYSHFIKECSEDTDFICDNGRILKQLSGKSIVYINEIDLKWLVKQYHFKYTILEVYQAKLDYLPDWFISVIKELYKRKTDLKLEIKELKRNNASRDILFDKELELLQVKGLLNSVYGMSATDPVKDAYDIDNLGVWSKTDNHKIAAGSILDQYYKGAKNCMRYQWGAWCTSYARDELMTMYEIVNKYGTFLYADTDSLFYISNNKLEKILNDLNDTKHKYALYNNFYVILNTGKKHTFDKFDDENDDIKEFKFLHAKCYAFTCGNDKHLESTIAGVPKRILQKDGTYYYREDELKTLDNLNNKMIFTKCGGTSCFYKVQDAKRYKVHGHMIESAGGAIIFETDKKLSELDVKDFNYERSIDYDI